MAWEKISELIKSVENLLDLRGKNSENLSRYSFKVQSNINLQKNICYPYITKRFKLYIFLAMKDRSEASRPPLPPPPPVRCDLGVETGNGNVTGSVDLAGDTPDTWNLNKTEIENLVLKYMY